MKNSQYIVLKQAVAFCIDLSLVSLPLIVMPSIEIFPLFALLWFLYIPLCEYYFSQTLGMKVVGTHNSTDYVLSDGKNYSIVKESL